MEQSIDDPCRILEYGTFPELFPDILSEEPLVVLVDCNSISEKDLGAITILKRTFPHLRILLSFPPELRALAAKSITCGADAYILEPFFIDEVTHLIRQSYEGARNEIRQSLEMRMNALSLFIQGLAPEINNRLTPILGSLQLLMGKDGAKLGEEERKENYQCIYREAQRIAKTLNEIENFAKPRKPKKNTIALKSIVDQSISEAIKVSSTEVPIENDFHASMEKVLVDGRQVVSALSSVLSFLMENAESEEGRIVLSTHMPDASRILFTIQGYGTISLGEEANQAFIPLYLRKIVRFGHELGLASAYGLVRAHGGTIRIQSTRDGTRFHLSIPLEDVSIEES